MQTQHMIQQSWRGHQGTKTWLQLILVLNQPQCADSNINTRSKHLLNQFVVTEEQLHQKQPECCTILYLILMKGWLFQHLFTIVFHTVMAVTTLEDSMGGESIGIWTPSVPELWVGGRRFSLWWWEQFSIPQVLCLVGQPGFVLSWGTPHTDSIKTEKKAALDGITGMNFSLWG